MSVTLHLSLTGYTAGAAATVIEVQTASFDAVQVLNIGSQSTGAGAGKVTFNPFTVTRKPDANSATFWSQMCSGTPFKTVVLTATDGATPLFTFSMGLVAIKTMSISASETGGVVETVSFQYGQGAYGAAQQNADGSPGKVVTAGWDVVKNIKV
jgi:type VI protein secretion system component Hcp